MNAVVTNEGLELVANVLEAVFAPFSLRLYTAIAGGGPLGPGTEYADLTEAIFDGYATASISPNGVGYDPVNNRGYLTFLKVIFTKADGPTPETVLGWCLTANDGLGGPETILFGLNFSAPIVFANEGDSEGITPVLYLPPVN